MKTGDLIRQARKQAGLTQKALGEMCGIAESQIRQYEANKLNPKPETLKKIALPLGVKWFMLKDDDSERVLDQPTAEVFRERVQQILDSANYSDIVEVFGTGTPLSSVLEGKTRPTFEDIKNFSSDSGIPEDWLIGLSDDDSVPFSKARLGFESIDIGLITLKIKRFLNADLHQECSIEDAALIVDLIFDIIEPQNILAITKTIESASPEIRKAALAVLKSAAIPKKDKE